MPNYPVTFEMDYAERRSRLKTFFRGLLAMPHFLFAGVYTLVFFVVYVIAWLALMFTGRWPAGLYQFACGYLRYSAPGRLPQLWRRSVPAVQRRR